MKYFHFFLASFCRENSEREKTKKWFAAVILSIYGVYCVHEQTTNCIHCQRMQRIYIAIELNTNMKTLNIAIAYFTFLLI